MFFFSRFCSVDFVELHVSSRCSVRHVRFHSSHVSCASSHTLSLLSSPSLAPLRVRFRLCRRPLFAPLRVRFSLLSSPVFCASSRTLSPLSSSVSCACLRTLLLLSPVSWTSSRMPLVVSFQFLWFSASARAWSGSPSRHVARLCSSRTVSYLCLCLRVRYSAIGSVCACAVWFCTRVLLLLSVVCSRRLYVSLVFRLSQGNYYPRFVASGGPRR